MPDVGIVHPVLAGRRTDPHRGTLSIGAYHVNNCCLPISSRFAHHDSGYPDNTDLVIDDKGVPSLKRHRAAPVSETATDLETAIAERMPERTLLGILARTAHWLDWWRRFGPASIRYGGTGGIAYHYVSDTYIALFSKFIPCGVWEAVHLIDGLLKQESKLRPETVHTDTQGVAWCRFGNRGIIADNDPDEQEKIVKFSTLLANCVIFHTAVDMTTVIRDLAAEGWTITAEDLATLSPYLTAHIQRFGTYATDEVTLAPDAHLGLDLDLPPLAA